jgi:NAD(P)H-dependent flavin oxidoreductase YrpB (nitropropane dioxygenase family)
LTSRPFGVDLVTEFLSEDHIALCIEEQVPVVVFFGSMPERRHVKQLTASGTRVWMQVGSVADACEAVARGVEVIIAQGQESGGQNRAEAATFSLLPAVRAAVAPVPVVAAGGIADGRSMVAALALGAEAVWCGTRFLASAEAHAHRDYKARIVAAAVGDTVRTTLFGSDLPDQPMRVLRNRVVAQWAGREQERTDRDRAGAPVGRTRLDGDAVEMPRFSTLSPTPETTGDIEEMCLPAGESCGNIGDIRPAAQIIKAMLAEAKAAVDTLAASVEGRDPFRIEPVARRRIVPAAAIA